MDFWTARWEVGDRNAPECQIWRVEYGLIDEGVQSAPPAQRSLPEIADSLRRSLDSITDFAVEHGVDTFAAAFRRAKALLDSTGQPEPPYHQDLSPPGLMATEASRLLDSAQAAWVFGGMGSWNDLWFEDDDQERYKSVSGELFNLLNEAISAAVNSTAPVNEPS
ncbi:MAG: hypothetical protein AAGI52_17655 [Bacteroidota bacterium]